MHVGHLWLAAYLSIVWRKGLGALNPLTDHTKTTTETISQDPYKIGSRGASGCLKEGGVSGLRLMPLTSKSVKQQAIFCQ